MAATHTLPLASPGMAASAFTGIYNDLAPHRPSVKTGRSHPGAGHSPGFRQKLRRLVQVALPGVMQVKPNFCPS